MPPVLAALPAVELPHRDHPPLLLQSPVLQLQLGDVFAKVADPHPQLVVPPAGHLHLRQDGRLFSHLNRGDPEGLDFLVDATL